MKLPFKETLKGFFTSALLALLRFFPRLGLFISFPLMFVITILLIRVMCHNVILLVAAKADDVR